MDDYARIASSFRYSTPISNTPSYFWMLISLLAQRQAPEPSESFSQEYDYIIVGAGSAGSVVSNRLSECPFNKVLLLEAGGVPPVVSDVPIISRSFVGTDMDWNYTTTSQKYTGTAMINRSGPFPAGRGLGGTSSINGMLNVRGNRNNYDGWEELGAEGWGYDDVLPYFKKLEDNEELGPSYYHGINGPVSIARPNYTAETKDYLISAVYELGYEFVDINGETQIGFHDLQMSIRKGQRCSTSKAYLVPAGERTNLDIIINAEVIKILINEDNRAIGVQLKKDNKKYIVLARKEVILSAGTVNSAKLLILSGIGPKEELEKLGIDSVKNLPVGKNLQDHICTYLTYTINDDFPSFKTKLTEPYVRMYMEDKSGPLASSGVSLLGFLPKDPYSVEQPDYLVYLLDGVVNDILNYGIDPKVYNQFYKPYENKSILWCLTSNLHSRSKGSVTLRSSDPNDPPLIDPNYLENDSDVDDVIHGMMTCNRIADTEAMKSIGAKPLETIFPGCEKEYKKCEYDYLECQARTMIKTFNHQVGTARIGAESDPEAVVDPRLRVIGIDGLRVVDASVMPIVPSGNTNIPTIMVAEKASDIIKQDDPDYDPDFCTNGNNF